MTIRQITLPVPFPLKTVNVYLVAGSGGTVLVDTAFYSPESWERLTREISESAAAWGPLRAIVLTHHHPDHVGMAGRLQRHYGVPVLASPGEAALIPRVWSLGTIEGSTDFYHEHGVPADVLASITQEHHDLLAALAPLPDVEGIASNRPLALAGVSLTPIITPGHSPAHLCLFEPASGALLVGDHLLPRITPNIGWYPYTGPDPLHDFLGSLGLIEPLPAREVFPGHGLSMPGAAARIAELRVHHAERLTAIRAILDGSALSGYEIARRLFGADLTPQESRLAVVETLAHLEHLRHRGEVVANRERSGTVYRAR